MTSNLERVFPKLARGAYHVTSPADDSYNCVAWAAQDTSRWWWPDAEQTSYWPRIAPRTATLPAFVQAFNLLGYAVCATGDIEPGYEKIAIYSKRGGELTHVAKQQANGRWTSKLGTAEDIEHDALDALRGTTYGDPVLFLKRKRIGWLHSILRVFAKWLQRRP